MHDIDQFIDNLTQTAGWSGILRADHWGVGIIITTHLPVTGPEWEPNEVSAGLVRHMAMHSTLADAVAATSPLLDALFTAKAAKYGEPAAYPGLVGAAA